MNFDSLREHAMIYLASPYSKYPAGIEAANRDICALAANLLRHRVKVYSPIAHTHAIAIYGKIDPLDHAFWMDADKAMMELSTALLVATLPGWEDSKGICEERRYFRCAGKPTYFINPDTLEIRQ